MCQPGFPHDDHMHIRFFCSPDDIEAGCLDTAPIFPWQKQSLKAAGVSAKLGGALGGRAGDDVEDAQDESDHENESEAEGGEYDTDFKARKKRPTTYKHGFRVGMNKTAWKRFFPFFPIWSHFVAFGPSFKLEQGDSFFLYLNFLH